MPLRPIQQSFEIGVNGARCIGFGDILFPTPFEVELAIGFSSSREWLPKEGGLDGFGNKLGHDGGATTSKAENVNGMDRVPITLRIRKSGRTRTCSRIAEYISPACSFMF